MSHANGILDAATLSGDHDAVFDAVVVGSGAGGAVLAKELSEGGWKVAIVEEGGPHGPHRDLGSESIVRMYRDHGLTSTIGHPIIPIPLGCCFGGSTTINSGTCFRTPPEVLRHWREAFGLKELDDESLNRAFDRVEQELPVETADFRVMSRANTLVHDILEARGDPGAPLRRNTHNCEGCGMCCYGCTSGAKKSMDLSYLPRALNAGAAAYVHARANIIRRNNTGAADAIIAHALDSSGHPTGVTLTLHAPIIVAACGTLLTPQLLKQSGIARSNRHLGRHLTIHPASKVMAEFDETIDSWDGIPQAYYYDRFHKEGIMFEGISMPPDLGLMGMPFSGEGLAHIVKNYRHFTSFGFMIKDTSEGRLRWRPFLGPVYTYSLTRTDVERMRQAIVFLAKLFFEGGAKTVYVMACIPGNILKGPEDIARIESAPLRADDLEVMAFHPLGTARMGRSPAQGVCDPWHQVFGTPGLYICDGSVVPSPLGVNPQETIMALATRLSEHLLGRPLAFSPREKTE